MDTQIQKHCNFNILGGKATGTYRFINGFYGLTDMPATFQKTPDVTLRNCHNKFAFLDDILVITKGSITDHEKELDKILYLLDKENLAIKLQKCEFARKQIKFTPQLAEMSDPLRSLLSKNNTKAQNKLDWKNEHTIAFEKIKKQIINITEIKHFDINKETRNKSDASKKGLGACLEQKHGQIWKPVAYANRFLNRLEEIYSTNELELLAIVWALEHFKYYLYGNKFTFQTDH